MKAIRNISAALTFMLFATPAAMAGDNVVMVELFTSQGCSSCPPADENLAALAERDDVLALSMHVDYWDYLGWRDTFGKSEHTQRQIAYRDAMGARVIYTPQIVVHGTYDVPGYRPDLIVEAIGSAQRHAQKATVGIVSSDGMLKARLQLSDVGDPCTVWVATYFDNKTVQIERGENAGETIRYRNVVDKIMRVGEIGGAGTHEVALPQPGKGEGVAIWVQDNRTGKILTASFIED